MMAAQSMFTLPQDPAETQEGQEQLALAADKSLLEEWGARDVEKLRPLLNLMAGEPDLVDWDSETEVVKEINKILRPKVDEKANEICDMKNTVMHLAASLGLAGLMRILVRRHKLLNQINVRNSKGRTPLHLASLAGHLEVVKFLNRLPCLRVALEDKLGQTPYEIALEVGWHDIVRLLAHRKDMKDYMAERRQDRSVHGDGTNAILVGAALIASITFTGWLQPPLGFQVYYQFPRNATNPLAPPGAFQQYAAISEHTSLKVFWISNSLSFYCSIAAILAGAGAMVPRSSLHELAEVRRRRSGLYLAGFAFSWAVVCVLVAFTAAGLASLPPIHMYETYMISTLVVGFAICFYCFVTVRISDAKAIIKIQSFLDPAFYSSYVSTLLEQLSIPCGYLSVESRTRRRQKLYNPQAQVSKLQQASAPSTAGFV